MHWENRKILYSALVFGIAMAYLEATVVIYLRLLYYPAGFHFPLIRIPTHIAIIELGREASTLIMIYFAARLPFSTFKERFALFIFIFATWDLFYYFWLKILINWPQTWLDWDILFLIPAPWISPWLAPAIVSLGLIAAGLLIIFYPRRFKKYILSKIEWLAEIAAALLILCSFFWQTGRVMQGGLPNYYPWFLFLFAFIFGLFIFLRRFYLNKSL